MMTQATTDAPAQGDFLIRDFRFQSGELLPELRLYYTTLGTVARDEAGVVRNAVLLLHGTGGAGQAFLREQFAGVLFGPGQLLDATRYFLVLPDGIGHGGSSKPSDGLRARFPHYTYDDMVQTQHRLLTEGLGIDHLRLVMGTSMGGMQTWLWGQRYPQFMDALMPLASLPAVIAGRNRMMRRMILEAIRSDPEWRDGEYMRQPHSLIAAIYMLIFMTTSPARLHEQAPTRAAADALLDELVQGYLAQLDANDLLYQVDASRDYDPAPDLERIAAPLLAVNFADDQVNPPELGILERAITRVAQGRAVVIPASDATSGHRTHSLPTVWQHLLAELLAETQKR
jgi:homoserine O-acetyltransferase/O-succinyltransferase